MERDTTVTVIVGGRSAEHSNSIDSGAFVRDSLRIAGYRVNVVGITQNGDWLELDPDYPLLFDGGRSAITEGSPVQVGTIRGNVAFPILHGPFGEDGTIQGLFEMLGIPYVGCGVFSSAAAKDKVWANRLLDAAGLPRAAWQSVDPSTPPERVRSGLKESLRYPLFVKPARCGGSLGVSRVSNDAELIAGVLEARQYDPTLVIESALEIRDVECGVLEFNDTDEPRTSVVGETVAGSEHPFLDYDAKFFDKSVRLYAPADIKTKQAEELQRLAKAAFKALGCSGMARVDMFLTTDGNSLVNEVTTLPGFSAVSNFAKMWQASGVSAPELVDTLIQHALRRNASTELPA